MWVIFFFNDTAPTDIYTTSHLMTHAVMTAQGRALDVALLAGRPGEDGEIVLRYPEATATSMVTTLSGSGLTTTRGSSSWDAATGDLRIAHSHTARPEIPA